MARQCRVLLFVSLIFTCLTGVLPGSTDLGVTGPYEVGFTNYLLVDGSRAGGAGFTEGRPIPVFLWYPVDPDAIVEATSEAAYPIEPLNDMIPSIQSSQLEAAGLDRAWTGVPVSSRAPFPVVLFSPGWGATPVWHTSVAARLASHGYVVAVAYHYGDRETPWESWHHIAWASFNRPRDLSFVLDDLLAKNGDSESFLGGAINPDRVAASGWSLGGYAAMAMIAGDDNVCDTFSVEPWITEFGYPPADTCVPTFPDPRIRVIVPLDGSNQVLRFQELARVNVPALGMGQEWNTCGSWQARQHAAFTGHPAYRADVLNSNHQTFSDLCELAPIFTSLSLWPPDALAWVNANLCAPATPRPEAHRLISLYLGAFLKTYLEGESGYQNILTPGYALSREPNIEFFVTEKRNPKSIKEDWPGDFVYFPHQPGSQQARDAKDPKKKPLVPYMGH